MIDQFFCLVKDGCWEVQRQLARSQVCDHQVGVQDGETGRSTWDSQGRPQPGISNPDKLKTKITLKQKWKLIVYNVYYLKLRRVITITNFNFGWS